MSYERLDKYLEDHLPELLEDLAQLVSINSEKTEAEDEMPFGRGNAACSATAAKIAEKCGLKVRNYENYVVTADLAPDAPKGVDILAHLDVVPAGDGWTVTDPFTMKVANGRAYGRGTADDKGPAVCVLYAMRAIRALELPLHKNARLILGADEECGGADLDYYFEQETSAPFSLSPDAEFPMINIEKGGLHSGFHSDVSVAESCPRVLSISGGLKINVIPDKAETKVQGLTEKDVMNVVSALPDMHGIGVSCETKGDIVTIRVTGATGHASEPQRACNAVTALLRILAELPLSPAPIHQQIAAAAAMFPHGDYFGSALGVDLADEISGRTVLSLTICSFSPEKGFDAMFDCRACVSSNDENTTHVIYDRFRAAGLEPRIEKTMYEPHHIPEESALVQTLLDVYEDMTGNRPKPLCIGGGTYVHDIENGIAFGCGFEGLDNRLHAADEFITLEQLLFTCKIYARTILAFCGD